MNDIIIDTRWSHVERQQIIDDYAKFYPTERERERVDGKEREINCLMLLGSYIKITI